MPDNSQSEEVEVRATVQIPGEQTLSKSIVPSTNISLPLVLYSVRWVNVAVCFICVLFGMAFLIADVAAIAAYSHGSNHLVDYLVGPLLFIIMAYLGSIFLLFSAFCMSDVRRSGPALLITAEGITDFRSGFHLDWSSVARAGRTFNAQGTLGVYLYSSSQIRNLRIPLRTNPLSFGWRIKKHRVFVPVRFLNGHRYAVAETILALTDRSGGEIGTIRFWS